MRNHVRSMNYYGDKPYRLQPVNTENIKTDSYQRGLDRKKVNRIAANFDERIANEPKVSFRDGAFYVFDGQHTIAARKKLNGNQVYSFSVKYMMTCPQKMKPCCFRNRPESPQNPHPASPSEQETSEMTRNLSSLSRRISQLVSLPVIRLFAEPAD